MDNAEDQNVIESGAETNTGIDHTLEPVANPATEKNVDNQTPSDESGTNEIATNQLGQQDGAEANTSDASHEQQKQESSENKAEAHHASDGNADRTSEKQQSSVLPESAENEQPATSNQPTLSKHHERTDFHVFLSQRAAMRRRHRHTTKDSTHQTDDEQTQTNNALDNQITPDDSIVDLTVMSDKLADSETQLDHIQKDAEPDQISTLEKSQTSDDNLNKRRSHEIKESICPDQRANPENKQDSAKAIEEKKSKKVSQQLKVTSTISITLGAIAKTLGKELTRLNTFIHKGWFKFSFVLYTVIFVILPAVSVLIMQSSLYTNVSEKKLIKELTAFVTKYWIQQEHQALLNYALFAILYFSLIFLVNRFWVATSLYTIFIGVIATTNYFKVQMRSEPLVAADLNFLGNAGEISEFIPADGAELIDKVVRILIISLLICLICYILDSRRSILPTKRHISSSDKKEGQKTVTRKLKSWIKSLNPIVITARLLLAVIPFVGFYSFVWNLGVPGSWAKSIARSSSDKPILFSATDDMKQNGFALSFLRYVHVQAIDEPDGYNKETMQQLAEKYSQAASDINQTRTTNLTDNTVIMVLSESFSDPTRVPGISLSQDPMPNIRTIKEQTTSGLALSHGYGGGTANIEYQALSGLGMANFNPSLQVAYQQLIPQQKSPATFNQLWNDSEQANGSQAFHSYNKSMYFRSGNYKKFGFSKFWTADGPDYIAYKDKIDSAQYISDDSTYKSVLKEAKKKGTGNQFLQVVTMQNHVPYYDWYNDNEFKENDASEYQDDYERQDVETYSKGMQYTDTATKKFLDQLDTVDKPITVVFYGDHLPGIYKHAVSDSTNTLGLHETDYFIWSNKASNSSGVKNSEESSGITSSNYFMAQTAEQLNAKVSPFLAFLTQMHEAVPAMAPAGASASNNSDEVNQSVYLDNSGNRVSLQDLPENAQQLLSDYKLIQYDLTVGKGYLKDFDFTQIPQ